MAATQKLRLFNTVGDDRPTLSKTSKLAYIPYKNGSSSWGPLHALTASWPLALSNLVLLTSDPECDDQVLIRFRDQLVPTWRYASWTIPYFSWHYQNFVEYGPQGGVPGLCAFVVARHKWMDEQIRAGVAAGCTQIVLMRTGYDSRPFTMRFPHTKFFVVDSFEALHSQRDLLEAVLPSRNLHPRPSYVTVSWDNLATFIPALTAAGFDPGSKAVFVAEGLLPHLDQDAVETLLSDVSALAAPGSVLAFDFLHEDVLEGTAAPSGYANLAMALANKGLPFLSGMRPVYSTMVRQFQELNMRVGAIMSPADISAWSHGADRTKPLGSGGQDRCSMVAGLVGGMPRYLSLATATKAGARYGLHDAPQQATAEVPLTHDGSPDTPHGGPNCFVASLFMLLCGAHRHAPAISSGAGAHAKLTPSGNKKAALKGGSGGTALLKSKSPRPASRRASEASTSSSACGSQELGDTSPVIREQSSEWMLRADTEQLDASAADAGDSEPQTEPRVGQEETLMTPPDIGLDRAQSILPQSSGSSLTSHAAMAIAAESAIAAQAAEQPSPMLEEQSDRYALQEQQPGKSVHELRKLFNSLS